MGRTQLQDAVPMTLGQEFKAFGETLLGEIRALEAVQRVLCEINMGATAIGTGLNAPAGYAQAVHRPPGRDQRPADLLGADLIEATQDTQAFVLYSSCMKSLAIKLSKICNDLRLLSSGPRCGLHEINLPPKQPGSSIMPGKVNPVIPEVVNMVCFRVIGSDQTISMAAEAGQLQLNVFEPVIAACIFEAQTMFINAVRTLREHCVDGHHGQPGRLPALCQLQHRHRHGAESGDRLRARDRAGGRSGENRPRHPRARARESDPLRAADRRGARPDGDDRSANSGVTRIRVLFHRAGRYWSLLTLASVAASIAGAANRQPPGARSRAAGRPSVAAHAADRSATAPPPSSSCRARWC